MFFVIVLLFDIYLFVRLSETWDYIAEFVATVFGIISSIIVISPIIIWINDKTQKKKERKKSVYQIHPEIKITVQKVYTSNHTYTKL